jgi:opacity protein-like surface antigen
VRNLKNLAILVLAVLVLAAALPANAENFIGVYGGYQFGARGTDMRAQENLGYPSSDDLHPSTATDITLKDNPTIGVRFGRYFDALPGFGIEAEGQYSRPDFIRQDVTIKLTDTNIDGLLGHSSFTEDQLSADFHVLMGGVNLLYRFQPIEQFYNTRLYAGGGPAAFGLLIQGSGNSCRIVAPAELKRGYCDADEMTSAASGIGFNAKAGIEIPISDRWSFDAEYKYSYGSFDADWFRSFSDIKLDYQVHNITGGLRVKF